MSASCGEILLSRVGGRVFDGWMPSSVVAASVAAPILSENIAIVIALSASLVGFGATPAIGAPRATPGTRFRLTIAHVTSSPASTTSPHGKFQPATPTKATRRMHFMLRSDMKISQCNCLKSKTIRETGFFHSDLKY